MAGIKKILCFVSMNAHYQVLKDACLDYIKFNHQKVSIIFLFCSTTFNLTRQIDDAKDSKFETFVLSIDNLNPNKNTIGSNNETWPGNIVEENRKLFFQMVKTLRNIIPDLALISDNTIKHKVPFFVRACKIQKVPVMNIPFSLYLPTYDLKLGTKPCLDNYSAFYNPWLRKDSEGNSCLPLPVEELVSLDQLKIKVPRPWAWNANEIQTITVDSEYAYKLNLKQGLDSRTMIKIRSTNFSKSDDLSTPIGPRIIAGFRPTLPSVLINVPAPLLGLLDLPQCRFNDPIQVINSYLKLPEYILERANIIWSVHPRINKMDHLYASEWGVLITDTPARELIPHCDIFIGSDSTLFKTALMQKKPVINYQIRGDITLYCGIGGCLTVTNTKDYISLIKKMLDDKIYYERVRVQINEDEFGYKSVSLPSTAELIHKNLNAKLI